MHQTDWTMSSSDGSRHCNVAGWRAFFCQIIGEDWVLEAAVNLLPQRRQQLCGFLFSGGNYAIWIEIFKQRGWGIASRSGEKSLCMFQQTNKLPMEMHLGIFLSNWISAVVSLCVPPGCGGKNSTEMLWNVLWHLQNVFTIKKGNLQVRTLLSAV